MKPLVIGASGFLGSQVTRRLVNAGHDVCVMVRETSDRRGLYGLYLAYHYGDIFDQAALRKAMQCRDVVFYCDVDTRAWLRDPAPLFRTNVEAGARCCPSRGAVLRRAGTRRHQHHIATF